jgi:branched-chain amino acid aminotransferase
MALPIISSADAFKQLSNKNYPHFEEYYAFYSTWLGGVVKNPEMMLIPIDDHMVHRGDGVFEALKSVGRSVFLLDQHLDRLFISAQKIHLQIPCTKEELKNIIIETLKIADQDDAMVRLYVSRGPGSFTVNPYDSVGSQLYVAITKLQFPHPDKYKNGVTLGRSTIPVKDSWLAPIKSCNYLPNVLMKKEAMDRQVDFVVGIDDQGYITESATENVVIVDQTGTLVHPEYEMILKGTMMQRVCALARENGIKTDMRPITLDELKNAQEVMLTGTTISVLPATSFEGHKIGSGMPGDVTQKLMSLIRADIKQGPCSTKF